MGIVLSQLVGESVVEQYPDKLVVDFAGHPVTLPLHYTDTTVIDGKYGSNLITGQSSMLTSLVGEIISFDNSKAWLIYQDGFMELIDRDTLEILEVNLIKDFNSVDKRNMKSFWMVGAYFNNQKGKLDIVFYNRTFKFLTVNRSDNSSYYIVRNIKKEYASALSALPVSFSKFISDDWDVYKYNLKLTRNGEDWYTNLEEVCEDAHI